MRSYNMKFDKQMHKKIWNQTVSFKKTTLQMKEKDNMYWWNENIKVTEIDKGKPNVTYKWWHNTYSMRQTWTTSELLTKLSKYTATVQ